MRILMLVNWKVEYAAQAPADRQPPDYVTPGEKYWFFRYFPRDTQVDVVDARSFPAWERFERNKLRFYIWQTLKSLGRLKHYDLVLSHGMQSGIVLCLWRRLFGKGGYKHVVFDIGAFNSAREEGKALKLMQYCSKTLDGVIYHTSGQRAYYKKCHPWLLDKSRFIPFGTDTVFFRKTAADGRTQEIRGVTQTPEDGKDGYILCIGYYKRDWETLLKAYGMLRTPVRLRLIGNERIACGDERVEILPPVSIRELMRQIQGSLFGCLPLQSFNYSYGQMTLQEQMAFGKAVITADVPSLRDYAEDGVTAVLYEPGNAEDLAGKLRLLLEDAGRRERIGKAAAESIEGRFNERNMAEGIVSYLEEVMEQA